jgi:hypothetical protein
MKVGGCRYDAKQGYAGLGNTPQNIENNPMHSTGIDIPQSAKKFDASGQIRRTMATSRNLQDAPGPARVMTTGAVNCRRAIANEDRDALAAIPSRGLRGSEQS